MFIPFTFNLTQTVHTLYIFKEKYIYIYYYDVYKKELNFPPRSVRSILTYSSSSAELTSAFRQSYFYLPCPFKRSYFNNKLRKWLNNWRYCRIMILTDLYFIKLRWNGNKQLHLLLNYLLYKIDRRFWCFR